MSDPHRTEADGRRRVAAEELRKMADDLELASSHIDVLLGNGYMAAATLVRARAELLDPS